MKRAEAGDGLILRLVETLGAACVAQGEFFGRTFDLPLAPHSVVTLHLPDDPALSWTRRDFTERQEADASG